MKNLRIVDILKTGQVGAEITVKGWVRTRRGSKNVNFIALNDGSTINNLQIVADVETFGEEILKNIRFSQNVTHSSFCAKLLIFVPEQLLSVQFSVFVMR